MKLEILISTYGAAGIQRLAQPDALPVVDGVGYLISWQRGGCEDAVPSQLQRPDIKVVIAESVGLGANRANSIDNAQGEWCLMADDDLIFDFEGIKRLLAKVDEMPDLDFAIAQSSGADNKYFPAEEYDVFPLRRMHFVTEFELLLRLNAVRRAKINYNPNFGVGSPTYTAGEGAVFMYEMRRKHLKGRYFPIRIVDHPGLTTSERVALLPGVLKSVGVTAALEYPLTGLARIVLVAHRRSKRFNGSFFRALKPLVQGFMSGIFKKSSLGIGQ